MEINPLTEQIFSLRRIADRVKSDDLTCDQQFPQKNIKYFLNYFSIKINQRFKLFSKSKTVKLLRNSGLKIFQELRAIGCLFVKHGQI